MTIRIAVIDDHPVVVSGLTSALGSVADFALVGTAGTFAEGLALLARDDIDVALVDVRLPDGNGIDLAAAAARADRPAVIMLSTFGTTQYLAAAIRHGAQGFLGKTAPLVQIEAAIRAVASGRLAYSREQLTVAASGAVILSPRDRDVLELVTQGRTNDEIAARLGVQRKTVESYLSRLYERFGVLSRTELAIRAEREGWLETV
jgi:two-component system response regulator DesR